MSNYHGDIQLGDTVEWTFTTVNSSGVPTQLAGSPTATAYTDGGLTESATGVTLTADFDGVTGLNLISVAATSGNGFAAGENIEIVLNAGTVSGNSVVGYAVGGFSIENRSNLRPTTVGNNEVDVTATGAVGVDWGNVENQGTTVDLSATDINLVDTTTTNTDMRGTDNAALASVVGALADAAAAGDPTASDTLMQYAKQLVNVLVGTTGVTTWAAGASAGNGVSMSEVLRVISEQTDQLAFGVANQVDANVESINTAGVVGDGNATPWDGA